MEVHEAAAIFPFDESTIDSLADDIRTHGLVDAIRTLDGKIIDGRRRFEACKRAKVTPRFAPIEAGDPIAYVVSLNLHRRHLDVSQRAMVAVKAKELIQRFREEGKQRQSSAGGDRTSAKAKALPVKSPEALPRGETREKVAQLFDISGSTVQYATEVVRDGIPELIQAVEEGEIKVYPASQMAKKTPEEQREEVKRLHQTPPVEAKPPEQNGEPKRELKGVGVIKANEALNILTRIPKNDALRESGFRLVKNWINSQLRRKKNG